MAIGGVVGLGFACSRAQSIVARAATGNTYFKLAVSPKGLRAVAIISSCVAYSIVGALMSAWLWSASRAAASLIE